MPVVTNLWEVKLENCTAWKYGTARRFSLNLVMIQAKATLKEEGWGKLTENALAVDALVVGLGSKNSFDALQQLDPWARNAPKSVPDAKR